MKLLFKLFFMFMLIIISEISFAEQIKLNEINSGLQRLGISIGYGENHRLPSSTKDLFEFNSLKFSYGKRISPKVENILELSYSKINNNDNNSALWFTYGHRRYLRVSPKTAIGVQLSFGVVAMRHEINEQSTKNNFTEQLGIVYDYVVSERNTVSLEYIFSHVSNAGIKLPNVGINTSMVSLGYNWYY